MWEASKKLVARESTGSQYHLRQQMGAGRYVGFLKRPLYSIRLRGWY